MPMRTHPSMPFHMPGGHTDASFANRSKTTTIFRWRSVR
jgi:hypothetical protein